MYYFVIQYTHAQNLINTLKERNLIHRMMVE